VVHGAVRVQLDVADVQPGALLRAAGARRFAWNWAVAKIKANADQWTAEGTYGIQRADRVPPLTFFTLAKLWTHEKPDVAPWAHEHSTWTFRYALRDAANAQAGFLAGKRRFPGSPAPTPGRPPCALTCCTASPPSWPESTVSWSLRTSRRRT
jgi:putative transposase